MTHQFLSSPSKLNVLVVFRVLTSSVTTSSNIFLVFKVNYGVQSTLVVLPLPPFWKSFHRSSMGTNASRWLSQVFKMLIGSKLFENIDL